MVWRRCKVDRISRNSGNLLILLVLLLSFISRVLIAWKIPNFLMIDNGFGFAYHVVFQTERASTFPYRSLLPSYYSLPFLLMCKLLKIYTGPLVIFMAKLPTMIIFVLSLLIINRFSQVMGLGSLQRSFLLALISFNPIVFKWSIYYSPEIFATYLILISIMFLRKLSLTTSSLIGISLVFSFFLKYFFIIYVIPFLLYIGIKKRRKGIWIFIIFLLLTLFIGYSEKLYYLFRQPFFSLKGFLNMNVWRILEYPKSFSQRVPNYFVSYDFGLKLFLILFSIVFIKFGVKRSEKKLILFLTLFSFVAFLHPSFQWRILIPTLILTYVGLFLSFSGKFNQKICILFLLLVYESLFVYLISLYRSPFLFIDPNVEYREAILYIVNKAKPGSTISLEMFLFGGYNFLPLKEMYLKRLKVIDIAPREIVYNPNQLEYRIINSSHLIINTFYFPNFVYPIESVLRSNNFIPKKSFGVFTVYEKEKVKLFTSGFSINCSDISDQKYFLEGGWIWNNKCWLGGKEKKTTIVFAASKELNYTLWLGLHSLFPNKVTIFLNDVSLLSTNLSIQPKHMRIDLPKRFIHEGINYIVFRFSNSSTVSGQPSNQNVRYLYLLPFDLRIYCGILDGFVLQTKDMYRNKTIRLKEYYQNFFPKTHLSTKPLNVSCKFGDVTCRWFNTSLKICFKVNHSNTCSLFIPIEVKKKTKILLLMNGKPKFSQTLYPQIWNILHKEIKLPKGTNCITLKTLKPSLLAIQDAFPIALICQTSQLEIRGNYT